MRVGVISIALLGLIWHTGCQRGNPGGGLSGIVTIDGEPVRGGDVIVANQDGTIIQIGRIGNDGHYAVAEPPVGEVRLAVRTSQFKGFSGIKGSTGVDDTQGRGSGGMIVPDPKVVGMTYVAIPEHYEDYNTSGLTVQVKRGKMEHNIQLAGKKE